MSLIGAEQAAVGSARADRVLGLDEVTSRTTTVKCMGRTYGAVSRGDAVAISDLTDITRPVPLGSARVDGAGAWELRAERGTVLARTDDLLHAIAVLREARWPPRDQPSRLR